MILFPLWEMWTPPDACKPRVSRSLCCQKYPKLCWQHQPWIVHRLDPSTFFSVSLPTARKKTTYALKSLSRNLKAPKSLLMAFELGVTALSPPMWKNSSRLQSIGHIRLGSFLVMSFTQVPGGQQTKVRKGSSWHIRHSLPCGEEWPTVSICLYFVDLALVLKEGFCDFGFVGSSNIRTHSTSRSLYLQYRSIWGVEWTWSCFACNPQHKLVSIHYLPLSGC